MTAVVEIRGFSISIHHHINTLTQQKYDYH